MNTYTVHFDFTTVHSKGKFIGRSGEVGIETTDSIEELNKHLEDVQLVCARYILSQKPKWNILMLEIKFINQTK